MDQKYRAKPRNKSIFSQKKIFFSAKHLLNHPVDLIPHMSINIWEILVFWLQFGL